MKLQIICKECKAKIWLRQNAESRFEFQQIYGSKIKVKCKKCNCEHPYSKEDINARSRFVPFLSFIILCGGLFVSFKYLFDYSFGSSSNQSNIFLLPAGLIITGLVSSVLLSTEEKNKRNFNRS